MNKFGKLLLVITSLAPILGAFAINAYLNQRLVEAGIFTIVGFCLIIICMLLIEGCLTTVQSEPLNVINVKSADKHTLTFLLAYLLPFLTENTISFAGSYLTTGYVFTIIGLVIYHSNAFTFNPILACRNYHFYEVESNEGMAYLLLTKEVLHTQTKQFTVVKLTDYLYLDFKNND
ncbi:hypothetical protein [Gimesia chilikensis]|uniref:hypothetical protein n=1 Tax=Gimesia chilikensis TaxID=2605989 RepID=UPI003A939074